MRTGFLVLLLAAGCTARLSRTTSDMGYKALLPPASTDLQPGTLIVVDAMAPGRATLSCDDYAMVGIDAPTTTAKSTALPGDYAFSDDELATSGLSAASQEALKSLRVTLTNVEVVALQREGLKNRVAASRTEDCTAAIAKSLGGAVLVVGTVTGEATLQATWASGATDEERAAASAEIARVFDVEARDDGTFGGSRQVWAVQSDRSLAYEGIKSKGLTDDLLTTDVLSITKPE